MSKAEKFITDCTRNCSNECNIVVQKAQDLMPVMATETYYEPWLNPNQARKAIEIARKEMIEKAIGWIEEINNHHYIMRYSDSCEPPISELIEWFKNYMKKGDKDE